MCVQLFEVVRTSSSFHLSFDTMDNDQMRALYMTKDGDSKPQISIKQVPRPVICDEHVLVKIRAAAINPSDILNSQGSFHETIFPRIPGRDYAGTIVAGQADLVGRDVYGTSGNALGFSMDGTHAEYCLIPESAIAFKPNNLSFAQAATVGVPFTTATLAIRRGFTQSSDTVLVIGATGAVGSAACQIAAQKGCKVLKAARRENADVNLITDPELGTVKGLTDGKGVDVVIDTTGQASLMKAAITSLAPRGRLSYISAPRTGSTDLTFDTKSLYRQEQAIIGCNSVMSSLSETASDLQDMTQHFEDGQYQATEDNKLDRIRLEDAVSVYESLGNARGKKFVIVFD